MTEERKTYAGHLSAFGTILLWGTTFISTKILLNTFTPVEILVIRFLLGYLCLWLVFPRRMPFRPFKEELLFMASGLCGVTLYFLFENTAIDYSLASNVGIIVSIAPLFTGLLASFFLHEEKITLPFILGFALSISGIIVISLNGSMILKLNPMGDILAVLAAAVWAVYSIIMRKISAFHLNTIGVTRRMFFYGLLFMIPVIFVMGFDVTSASLMNITNLLNLIFLGLGASAVCYVSWNWSVGILGAMKTSVYIYLIPVIAVVASAIFLHEQITWVALTGALLTLFGLYISERKPKGKGKELFAES
jgi:drug/metabolite transporter (DMT)-like permease